MTAKASPKGEQTEVVAWYNPSNNNPSQSVTFSRPDRDKWPHLYPVALYAHPAGAEAPSVVGALAGISLEGRQGEPAGTMTVKAHFADGSERVLIADNGNVISHWKNASDLTTGALRETSVMVCPQCDGEGHYADGVDEAACSTPCTRCASNGWIVDLAALSPQALGEDKSPNAAEVQHPRPTAGSDGQAAKVLGSTGRPR